MSFENFLVAKSRGRYLEPAMAVEDLDRISAPWGPSLSSSRQSTRRSLAASIVITDDEDELDGTPYESTTMIRRGSESVVEPFRRKSQPRSSTATVVNDTAASSERDVSDWVVEVALSTPVFKLVKEGWLLRKSHLMTWKATFARLHQHIRQSGHGQLTLFKDQETTAPFRVIDILPTTSIQTHWNPQKSQKRHEISIGNGGGSPDLWVAHEDISEAILWYEALSACGQVMRAQEMNGPARSGSVVATVLPNEEKVNRLFIRNQDLEAQIHLKDARISESETSKETALRELETIKQEYYALQRERNEFERQLKQQKQLALQSSVREPVATHSDILDMKRSLMELQKSIEHKSAKSQSNSDLRDDLLQIIDFDASKKVAMNCHYEESPEFKEKMADFSSQLHTISSQLKKLHHSMSRMEPVESLSEPVHKILNGMEALKSSLELATKSQSSKDNAHLVQPIENRLKAMQDTLKALMETTMASKTRESIQIIGDSLQNITAHLLNSIQSQSSLDRKVMERFDGLVAKTNNLATQEAIKSSASDVMHAVQSLSEAIRKDVEFIKVGNGKSATQLVELLRRGHEEFSNRLSSFIGVDAVILKEMQSKLRMIDQHMDKIQTVASSADVKAVTEKIDKDLPVLSSMLDSYRNSVAQCLSGIQNLGEKPIAWQHQTTEILKSMQEQMRDVDRSKTIETSISEMRTLLVQMAEKPRYDESVTVYMKEIESKVDRLVKDWFDDGSASNMGSPRFSRPDGGDVTPRARSTSPRKMVSYQETLLQSLQTTIHGVEAVVQDTQRKMSSLSFNAELSPLSSSLGQVKSQLEELQRSHTRLTDTLQCSDQAWRTELRQSLRFDHEKLLAVERSLSELSGQVSMNSLTPVHQSTEVITKRVQDILTCMSEVRDRFQNLSGGVDRVDRVAESVQSTLTALQNQVITRHDLQKQLADWKTTLHQEWQESQRADPHSSVPLMRLDTAASDSAPASPALSPVMLEKKRKELDKVQAGLMQCRAQMALLMSTGEDRTAHNASLEARGQELQATLTALQTELSQKRDQLAHVSQQAEDKSGELTRLTQSCEELKRNMAVLQSQRDRDQQVHQARMETMRHELDSVQQRHETLVEQWNQQTTLLERMAAALRQMPPVAKHEDTPTELATEIQQLERDLETRVKTLLIQVESLTVQKKMLVRDLKSIERSLGRPPSQPARARSASLSRYLSAHTTTCTAEQSHASEEEEEAAHEPLRS